MIEDECTCPAPSPEGSDWPTCSANPAPTKEKQSNQFKEESKSLKEMGNFQIKK